jgi:hypothetical protein
MYWHPDVQAYEFDKGDMLAWGHMQATVIFCLLNYVNRSGRTPRGDDMCVGTYIQNDERYLGDSTINVKKRTWREQLF